jgi:hypothetical protein
MSFEKSCEVFLWNSAECVCDQWVIDRVWIICYRKRLCREESTHTIGREPWLQLIILEFQGYMSSSLLMRGRLLDLFLEWWLVRKKQRIGSSRHWSGEFASEIEDLSSGFVLFCWVFLFSGLGWNSWVWLKIWVRLDFDFWFFWFSFVVGLCVCVFSWIQLEEFLTSIGSVKGLFDHVWFDQEYIVETSKFAAFSLFKLAARELAPRLTK